ncbi:helix-turn-helix domain containing protein [Mycolicibacterium septicum]|uniref:TetR/AcrR family transcriptional regulator n=1 Tax=Mycolicibacterium septicum TaxID=98668 RepID=UPI0023E35117|nr:TetR/AcrR family transcriptional regulator [Mycolicibacterium septicum]MDF3339047.1 helix-turn-helix domain containing protein [Mycolicibacterium septicum]
MVRQGRRKEAAARTREGLIDAGLQLAEQTGLTGLSIDLIVKHAGVAKGTFFHHFGDRASYLLALHREFHERLAAQLQAAVAGLPPGRDRLITGATTWLDGCLRDRGVRAAARSPRRAGGSGRDQAPQPCQRRAVPVRFHRTRTTASL